MLEIKLNYSELSQKLSDVSDQVSALQVSPLGVNISSQSDAMDQFISLYSDYSLVMQEYASVLAQDLERIKLAALTLESADDSLAEQFLIKK